jgi:MraZ protein
MPLLVGQHINRIDRKGRVSVPKQFRDYLEGKGGFPGVYVYPSPVLPAVDACDEQAMERVATTIANLDLFSEEQNDFAMLVLGSAHALPFDPEGRVVLPAALVDHAGLDGEAMFVGCGFTFQIWNPATYKPLENERAVRFREQGRSLPLGRLTEAPR